jgi:hypothetical protein
MNYKIFVSAERKFCTITDCLQNEIILDTFQLVIVISALIQIIDKNTAE